MDTGNFRRITCWLCLAAAYPRQLRRPWRSFCHVRAHCGHHWNEFADVLAKAAVATDPWFEFHIDVGAWVRDRALESLWLFLAAWREPDVWPRLQGSSLVWATKQQSASSASRLTLLQGRPRANGDACALHQQMFNPWKTLQVVWVSMDTKAVLRSSDRKWPTGVCMWSQSRKLELQGPRHSCLRSISGFAVEGRRPASWGSKFGS